MNSSMLADRTMTRAQEGRALMAAHRQRDRARRIDAITYRFRGLTVILAATGVGAIACILAGVAFRVTGVL